MDLLLHRIGWSVQVQLTALVKSRLQRMQYRPALLGDFLTSTGLDLTPFCIPTIKDR